MLKNTRSLTGYVIINLTNQQHIIMNIVRETKLFTRVKLLQCIWQLQQI